jgi:hypothetical protein
VYNYYMQLINRLGVYKGTIRLLGVLQEMEDKKKALSREYERLSKRVSSLELTTKQLEDFNTVLIMRLKEECDVDL